MSYGKIFPLGGSGGSTPSGIAGAIQFSNGSAFASDAANLFWDNTNKRLGVGTNSPTATAHILGSSNTATDYALKILNLRGQGIFSVANDGITQIGDFTGQGYNSQISFLRPSGATRGTTITQGNSNLTIENLIGTGSAIFQNFPIQIVGRGSTSATTSLLVQNSAGAESLKVADNRVTTVYGLGVNSSPNIGQVNFNLSDTCIISTPSNINFKSGITDQSVFFLSAGNSAIGINTTSPNASASFDISSTTKGFLPPRQTVAQRTAIVSPAVGLMVYQTDGTEGLYIYKSTGWTFIA